jgi:uncharacterized protein (TIGR02145 family)
MEDGRIWMVQDLKFGDKCGTDFSGSNGSDQKGKVTSLTDKDYFGDCTTLTDGSTPANRGYLYDWAAAIQKAGAYYGSGSNVGCSGTGGSANACQGICPAGWHIPTGASSGEFYDLHNNYGRGCSTNNDDCWDAASTFEGVLGGGCASGGTLEYQGSVASYWSSTYANNNYAYHLYFYSTSVYPGTTNGAAKNYGRSVRCVRNY